MNHCLNRWLSLGIVLTLGFLLGIMGFSTWDKNPSSVEQVAWSSDTQWIAPREPTYRFYTRRTFEVDNTVQAAWLRLSADNNFILYVNGKEIARQYSATSSSLGLASRLSDPYQQRFNDSSPYRVKSSNHLLAYPKNWKVAAYVDLTAHLHPGKNAIALEIQKAQKNPRVVIEGAVYTVPETPQITLNTGATPWKVSNLSENRQGLQWFETDFPDHSWLEAKVIGPVQEATYSRLSQNLYDRFLQGNWITGTESPAGEVWLRGSWQIPESRQRAFIRFAGDGEYALLINGLLMKRYGTIKPDTNLHMYEVTNFLKTGRNVLEVHLTRSLNADLSKNQYESLNFFLDGWVETKQGTITAPITTDNTWVTWSEPSSSLATDSVQEQPATILGLPNPQKFKRLFEGNAYLLNYPDYLWHMSFWCLGGIGCALIGAFGLGWYRLGHQHTWWYSFNAGAGLLLPGTLVLIGIGLLKHRYAEAELGLLFAQSQSNSLILLGFSSIVILTLLWSQTGTVPQDRRVLRLKTFPHWGLWFLLGAIAFIGFTLLGGITFSWLPITLLTLLSKRLRWSLSNWFQAVIQTLPVWGPQCLLVLIIIIGFVLRAYNLDFTARDSDENTSLDATRGILRTGAPEATSGIWYTRGPFYHYMLALWLRLVGDSVSNARLLSAIFGTATLILVFIFTRKVTGKIWLALVVTAILAIDPWELLHSRNIRFYQTIQFFSLLSFWLFFKGFIERKGRNYQYVFFVVLTMMLLTQEVTVTILPCFLFGFLLFYRPFNLLVDWPILLGSFITILIYIYNGIFFSIMCLTPWAALSTTTQTQLKLHIFNLTDFLAVFFCGLSRMYTIYSLFFLLGFVYFLKRRDSKIIFLFSSVILTIVVVTLLVLQVGARYAYPIYPIFIMLSVYSVVCLMDSLGRRFESNLAGLIPLKNVALACTALLLITNIEPDRVLLGYQDALARHNPKVFEYIRQHKQPGDKVFVNLSSASPIAFGKSDYYIPPELTLRLDALYWRDGQLIDRWGGGVAVSNVDQISRILETANRVWLQLDDTKPPKDPQLLQLYNYIQTLGQPVIDTYGVRLRLWQREDGLLPRLPNRGQDLGAY